MKVTKLLNELLNVKEPADRVHMSLSEGHKWLAFCLNGSGEDTSKEGSLGVSLAVSGVQQWVCELESGKLIQIAPNASSSWGGVWSPDGKTLAFYADIDGVARLWAWSPLDHNLRRLSDRAVRPFFGFEKPIWTKDGRRIIVKTMPFEHEADHFFNTFSNSSNIELEYVNTPLIFSTNCDRNTENETDRMWANRYKADIGIINSVTGETVDLCTGKRPVGMLLSNDGNFLAFMSCQGEESEHTQQIVFDLWICPIRNDVEPWCVANNIRMDYGMSFSWGCDNQTILYTTRGPLSDGGLWSVQISKPNRPTLLGIPENVHLGREYDGPISLSNGGILTVAEGCLWYYSPEDLEFHKVEIGRHVVAAFPTPVGTGSILVQTRNIADGVSGFWEVQLFSWEANKILEEDLGHVPWFEGGAAYGNNAGERRIAYFAQNADRPPALKININDEKQKTIELSEIREVDLGTTELITWNSNNQNLRGALLLPNGAEGKVPVIVRVYGGAMQSEHFRKFGLCASAADNHHIFASNGFAVFLPDLPMRRTNEPANEIKNAIDEAVQVLRKHDRVDPDRIGIIGHSFGGYSALVAITNITVFKAAVISAGIGSLISFYTDFDPLRPSHNYGWVEDGQANLGATLWEETDRYIRNSPIFELDQVQAPILIIQGLRDHLCRNEAGPIFSSLNRLKKTASLVIYNEEHWQGTWSRESIEDYYHRVIKWFEEYL